MRRIEDGRRSGSGSRFPAVAHAEGPERRGTMTGRLGRLAAGGVGLVLLLGAAGAAAPRRGKSSGSSALPLRDPALTVGTLPNGMRYYLRVNKAPAHRVELRLAVNAGSTLEDKD